MKTANSMMLPAADGVRLYVCSDVAKGAQAALIMVHGMCEHSGRHAFLYQQLAAAGIGYCAFDLRGHGRSEGEGCHFDSADQLTMDVKTVIDWFGRQYPQLQLFLAGYSMGGFAAADYGIRFPENLAGVILLAGATRDVYGGFSKVDPTLDAHTRFENRLACRMSEDTAFQQDYMADPLNATSFTAGLNQQLAAGIERLKQDCSFALPLLLLHGEKDRLVAVEDSLSFFREVCSEDKTLILYGGAGHALTGEAVREKVGNAIIRWIGQHTV